MEQLFKLRGDANSKPTEKSMKDSLKISNLILFSYHNSKISFPSLKAGFTKSTYICNLRPLLNTKEPGFVNKRISNRYPHMLWGRTTKYWWLWTGSSRMEMLLESVRWGYETRWKRWWKYISSYI